MALPKANRLRERKEFTRVYRRGQRWSGSYLLLRITPQQRSIAKKVVPTRQVKPEKPVTKQTAIKQSTTKPPAIKTSIPATPSSPEQQSNLSPAESSRIAVVVSLKVSKRAVVRNRLRRQVQAALQQSLPQLRPRQLIVITVKPTAVECDYYKILRELESLLIKAEAIHGH